MAYYNYDGKSIVAYTYDGKRIGGISGDTPYEQAMADAINLWVEEYSSDANIVPMVIHADQHSTLNRWNETFPFISRSVTWEEVSACIGLGDVNEYINDGASHDGMLVCLKDIPKAKQINIWGNHDTWGKTGDGSVDNTIDVYRLATYFDNSAYPNHHLYNQYGIETMVDDTRHIRYVCFGGWEYDPSLGNHQTYNIGYDGMESMIDMLSKVDDNDIVTLSHIQPFANQSAWTRPPVEDGTTHTTFGKVFVTTPIDQMLIDRKNKARGTVKDSHGNDHTYDFTGCTSDLICCFAGHEHVDGYAIQGNVPVYVYDAHAYDARPIYLANLDRVSKRLHLWKIDNTPTFYDYVVDL